MITPVPEPTSTPFISAACTLPTGRLPNHPRRPRIRHLPGPPTQPAAARRPRTRPPPRPPPRRPHPVRRRRLPPLPLPRLPTAVRARHRRGRRRSTQRPRPPPAHRRVPRLEPRPRRRRRRTRLGLPSPGRVVRPAVHRPAHFTLSPHLGVLTDRQMNWVHPANHIEPWRDPRDPYHRPLQRNLLSDQDAAVLFVVRRVDVSAAQGCVSDSAPVTVCARRPARSTAVPSSAPPVTRPATSCARRGGSASSTRCSPTCWPSPACSPTTPRAPGGSANCCGPWTAPPASSCSRPVRSNGPRPGERGPSPIPPRVGPGTRRTHRQPRPPWGPYSPPTAGDRARDL